ncbi:hypothetical protein Q5752_005454 [Cryptotrichosporon argae]
MNVLNTSLRDFRAANWDESAYRKRVVDLARQRLRAIPLRSRSPSSPGLSHDDVVRVLEEKAALAGSLVEKTLDAQGTQDEGGMFDNLEWAEAAEAEATFWTSIVQLSEQRLAHLGDGDAESAYLTAEVDVKCRVRVPEDTTVAQALDAQTLELVFVDDFAGAASAPHSDQPHQGSVKHVQQEVLGKFVHGASDLFADDGYGQSTACDPNRAKDALAFDCPPGSLPDAKSLLPDSLVNKSELCAAVHCWVDNGTFQVRDFTLSRPDTTDQLQDSRVTLVYTPGPSRLDRQPAETDDEVDTGDVDSGIEVDEWAAYDSDGPDSVG